MGAFDSGCSTSTRMPGETHAMRTLLTLVACTGLLLTACPEEMSTSAAKGKRPSEALAMLVDAAKKGDVETFKTGLSSDFVSTVERYQQMASAKEELQGAFDWPIFMRSLSMSDPVPKEESINGNKAKVKALHKDGREGLTEMVLEDGTWKLAVPPGLVKGLDHFDDVAKMAMGEAVAPKPDIPQGGGGKADRLKNLPPDASPADKAKAAALDMFDLGDIAGAEQAIKGALEGSPGDEELTVALGRVLVQQGKGKDAITLYETYLKDHDKSVTTRHYLGMAYMMDERAKDAAGEWEKVMEIDPAYASKFKLDQRRAAALAIAEGRVKFVPPDEKLPGKLVPTNDPLAGQGAAASQPAGGTPPAMPPAHGAAPAMPPGHGAAPAPPPGH
jgi:tetratricopeptide (TPR) repeat protein